MLNRIVAQMKQDEHGTRRTEQTNKVDFFVV